MPKVNIITTDGTKKGQLDLPTALATEPKKELLHQAVVTYLANQRTANAHTKTRGEVRGGGRKPWKQKGTGRARAGSSRSPIWVGGGITFGPRNDRNYSLRMPERMKRLALSMAVSAKAAAGELQVIEALTLHAPKTKEIHAILQKIHNDARSILIVTASNDATLLQAAQNLPYAAVTTASDLNVYDLLSFRQVLMTSDAMPILEQRVNKTVKPVEKAEK